MVCAGFCACAASLISNTPFGAREKWRMIGDAGAYGDPGRRFKGVARHPRVCWDPCRRERMGPRLRGDDDTDVSLLFAAVGSGAREATAQCFEERGRENYGEYN